MLSRIIKISKRAEMSDMNENSMAELNQISEKLFKENPELQKIMTLFGETMHTYTETLAAMGQLPTYSISSNSTSSPHLAINSASSFHLRLGNK